MKCFFPLLLLLSGCITNAVQPQDVFGIACAPSDQYQIERCAESVGDVYGVYQTRALEIVSDPATPDDVSAMIQQIDRELTPAVRLLVQTAAAYIVARDAQAPDAGAMRAALAVQLQSVRPKVATLPTLQRAPQ